MWLISLGVFILSTILVPVLYNSTVVNAIVVSRPGNASMLPFWLRSMSPLPAAASPSVLQWQPQKLQSA